MGECSTELRLVFSNDEVARRVLKVSHSNDPFARSLTLQILAKLASVVAENKQVMMQELNEYLKDSRSHSLYLVFFKDFLSRI